MNTLSDKKRLYISMLESLPYLEDRGLTGRRLLEYDNVINHIQGYEKEKNTQLVMNEMTNYSLLAFGNWLKNEGLFTYKKNREVVTKKRRAKANNTIIKLLRLINTHMRECGYMQIDPRMLEKKFPFQTRIPRLPDDIIQAILHTQVEGMYRPVLDAIKLIIMHGFRYSDFWMLRKIDCIKTTEDGLEYFNYIPAKNYNSVRNRYKGVSIPVHPLAKPIIRYWEDRDTGTWMNLSRILPQALLDKDYAPHIIFRHGPSPSVYFNRPIIKIPKPTISKKAREVIFRKAHNDWYISKYGIDWDDSYKPEGLMKEVIYRGETMRLYQSLTFHYFRHIYCTRYLALGGSIMDLKENIGHSDIRRTLMYVHDDEEERLKRAFLLTK